MHGIPGHALRAALGLALLGAIVPSSRLASAACVPGAIASDRRGPADSMVAMDDWVILGAGAAVESIDLSDPWRPVRQARLDLTDTIRALHRTGTTIVVHSRNALTFLSIASSGELAVLGEYALPPSWVAQRIAVAGNFAYVATAEAGLRILDITNPALVVEVGGYSTASTVDVVVRGSRAYLSGAGGLTVLDVSDPAQPVPTGQLPGASGRLTLSPSGTRLANFGGQCQPHSDCGWLDLVDVSVPDHPVRRSRTKLSATVADVEFANALAYLVESTGNGWILNVNDLADPRVVGSFESSRPRELVLRLPLIYVADAVRGLRILRSLAPDETAEIALLRTPGPTTGGFLRNGIATTVHDRGLRIFDVSNPRHPSLLGERWPGVEHLADLEASATHAFVTSYGQGVRVYDLEDPAAPQTVAVFGERYPSALSLDGDELLVNGGAEGGARLYDVSDPEHPVPNGVVAPDESPTDVLLRGPLAVSLQSLVFGSLSTHDVSDPDAPVRLAYLGDVFALSVHAFGSGVIYTHWLGFTILDLSNPAQPAPIGSFPGVEYGNAVATYGSRAFYVAEDFRGGGWLQIVDLSTPGEPTAVLTAETAGTAEGVFAGPGVVVVADGDAGLTIFESCVAFADGFESGDRSAWSSSPP